MSDISAAPANTPGTGSKRPLILGLCLALLGGGGGFFAVQRGIGPFTSSEVATPEDKVAPLPGVAFVAVDPIIVSLPGGRVVRFRSQLEVGEAHLGEVQTMLPRVIDVMNGYLRALEPADFEDAAILPRLRGQLMRRVQVVVGDGRVRDILIMELVLN